MYKYIDMHMQELFVHAYICISICTYTYKMHKYMHTYNNVIHTRMRA